MNQTHKTMLIGTLAVLFIVVSLESPLHAQKKAPKENKESLQYDEAPVVVKRVMPLYPENAKKDGVEGLVYVKIFITTEGKVSKAEVIKSVRADLDSSAVAAARQWTFQPAKVKGKPIAVWITLPIRYKLEKGDK